MFVFARRRVSESVLVRIQVRVHGNGARIRAKRDGVARDERAEREARQRFEAVRQMTRVQRRR